MPNFDMHYAVRRELPAVLAIEQACFPVPWTEEDVLACLRQRYAVSMVATIKQQIVGWVVYELRQRELMLVRLAVDPDWQRRGIGRAMMNRLKAKLTEQRRNRLRVMVPDANLPAQLFFRERGFKAVRVHRGFYADELRDDDAQDAYEMVYRLQHWTQAAAQALRPADPEQLAGDEPID